MKSVEEVINQFIPDHSYSLRDGLAVVTKFDCYNKNKVKRMMEEFAKEVAIDFYEFARKYIREENRQMAEYHRKIGGITTWAGATYEMIFDEYLKSKTNESGV